MPEDYRAVAVIAALGVDVGVGVFCTDYTEDFENRVQVEFLELSENELDDPAVSVLDSHCSSLVNG
jgi:hypothetical protein